MNKILVAIPCYNCEKQLPRVLKKIQASLSSLVAEVLIVDNQSKDGTLKAAQQFLDENKTALKTTLLRNDRNYGLGGSHKVAFNYALQNGFDYVGIIHGDDQAEPQEFCDLAKAAEKDPSLDAVLGSRFMLSSTLKGYSKVRILGNLALNCLYSLASMDAVKDLGSGINLFKTAPLKDGLYLGFSDQFTFNMDLLLYYQHFRKKILFYPITWKEEDQVSNARNFSVGVQALKTLKSWKLGEAKTSHDKKPSQYSSTQIK